MVIIDTIQYDYIIVGCGLSGCVIAERIAYVLNKRVLILEKRDHIGGNCYDYIDEQTNIRVNKYGAHLFHTNDKIVWDYINKFSEWVRWEHKVLSYVDDKYVSIPVNITTINELCSENLENERDVKDWLKENQVTYDTIENSEQMAKSRIGNILYEKLIKNYTYKQWNLYPEQLKPSVLERIPIRSNFDTRYFNDKYQALPKNGYTHLFETILNNDKIDYFTNVDFFEFKKYNDINIPVIYTGPIDTYFQNKGYEKLEYRSIDFHIQVKNMNFYQPNSVVNFPSIDSKYTRQVEYKHFLNQKSDKTIIVSETTNDHGEPYYPVPNEKNLKLYETYKELSDKEKDVYFVGRLANYKYFNMDQAISNALQFFNDIINI